MDVSSVHVDREADADPRDAVEEWPPRGDIEERGHHLAPRREPRPSEVGHSKESARLRADASDPGQRDIGSRDVGRVDDQAIREADEIAE